MGLKNTRFTSFSWKLILSDTQNVGYTNIVIGLYRDDLCDGFYIVKGYTISRNRWDPRRIYMILVFRSQRQVMGVQVIYMVHPSFKIL